MMVRGAGHWRWIPRPHPFACERCGRQVPQARLALWHTRAKALICGGCVHASGWPPEDDPRDTAPAIAEAEDPETRAFALAAFEDDE